MHRTGVSTLTQCDLLESTLFEDSSPKTRLKVNSLVLGIAQCETTEVYCGYLHSVRHTGTATGRLSPANSINRSEP
jgi:hypothetical protein